MASQTEKRADEVDLPTRLALERTRVAYDRTMLAWVRTAASLITFGFTIYKYFEIQRVAPPSEGLIGPREFSIILIGIGLSSLVLAVWQHRQDIRSLSEYYPETPRSLANGLAVLIALLGILALIAVIRRL